MTDVLLASTYTWVHIPVYSCARAYTYTIYTLKEKGKEVREETREKELMFYVYGSAD